MISSVLVSGHSISGTATAQQNDRDPAAKRKKKKRRQRDPKFKFNRALVGVSLDHFVMVRESEVQITNTLLICP